MKGISMKKVLFLPILFLCTAFLAGCGGRETKAVEYFDIRSETEQIFDIEETTKYILLGMQYYQGERVQFWADKTLIGEDGAVAMEADIFLHREDGSRELFLADIPYEYLSGKWWLDKGGRCFILRANGVQRLDEEGREVFFRRTGENVKDICQLADGRIVLLLVEDGKDRIAELDPDTGTIDMMESVVLRGIGNQYIGAEGNSLLLLKSDGLWEVDMEDGGMTCRMGFTGTSYVWKSVGAVKIEAFQASESGGTELLWNDGTAETLRLSRVDEDRAIVSMRGIYFSEWMKAQVVRFNQKNPEYYIVLEEWEQGTDMQEFCERTDMELAVGKGADIIFSSSVNDAYSLMKKGAFEDLRPFMEKSGIKEADYFPFAFAGWQDGGRVYGVNVTAEVEGVWFDRKVTGSDAGPEHIEALADSMLAYDGKAVFREGWEADRVLEYFLQGSENLWGMLDWERRTCDFDTELFAKLLKAAGRYGDSETNSYPAISGDRNFMSFTWIDSAEKLDSAGRVSVGYLFDDGSHELSRGTFLAVNAGSGRKEGAWEFISFLLGEEVQKTISAKDNYSFYFPVHREVFETLKEEAIADSGRPHEEGKWIVTYGKVTRAQAEDLTAALEGARQLPMRTAPILKIIAEEARFYFAGTKGIEEVCEMIENRVQLFLNERN